MPIFEKLFHNNHFSTYCIMLLNMNVYSGIVEYDFNLSHSMLPPSLSDIGL